MPKQTSNSNDRLSPKALGWGLVVFVVLAAIGWLGPRLFMTPREQVSSTEKLAPTRAALYDPSHPAKQVDVSGVKYTPSGPAVKLNEKQLVAVGKTTEGFLVMQAYNPKEAKPPRYPQGGGGGTAGEPLPPGLSPGTLLLKATNGMYQPIVQVGKNTGEGGAP